LTDAVPLRSAFGRVGVGGSSNHGGRCARAGGASNRAIAETAERREITSEP
jgi:hypothetical protein